MSEVGWLFDVYLEDGDAILWIKCESGNVLKLKDRYIPSFYVESENPLDHKVLKQVLPAHPNILSVETEEKFTSISMRKRAKVLHIFVDKEDSFTKIIRSLENLNRVKALYNVDLLHIQWYLFSRSLIPTSKMRFRYDTEFNLLDFKMMDDYEEHTPPPFTVLLFDLDVGNGMLRPNPKRDPIRKIIIYDEHMHPEREINYGELELLAEFERTVTEVNPDFLSCPDGNQDLILSYILERSKTLGYDIQLGREEVQFDDLAKLFPSATKGRVPLEIPTEASRSQQIGVCGVVEISRFTVVPPRLAMSWSAGKMIDSRQCYEALKRDILIPSSRGFFKFVTTAWDTLRRDRGPLTLSPKVGIHENVAEIDFESMFPNIITHFNISYETVTPNSIDQDGEGFLVALVRSFLERRLYFKHLRSRFPKSSKEWLCCEQRQLALKMCLVCIYGYSGCFANRFGNVVTYEEINWIARDCLKKTMKIVRDRGFEIIYADTDSVFLKRPDATKEDYEELCRMISGQIGLPISLDHHYRFLVLLARKSDPNIEATRHYFGRLMNGELYYRGIELRRHDYPDFLKAFELKLMDILLDARSSEEVLNRNFERALGFVSESYERVLKGEADFRSMVLSKVLNKNPFFYRSKFPHVSAAQLLTQKGENVGPGSFIDFVYINAEHPNPLRRVLPSGMVNDDHLYYDCGKYAQMLLDIAETVLGWNGFTRESLGFKAKQNSLI